MRSAGDGELVSHQSQNMVQWGGGGTDSGPGESAESVLVDPPSNSRHFLVP